MTDIKKFHHVIFSSIGLIILCNMLVRACCVCASLHVCVYLFVSLWQSLCAYLGSCLSSLVAASNVKCFIQQGTVPNTESASVSWGVLGNMRFRVCGTPAQAHL